MTLDTIRARAADASHGVTRAEVLDHIEQSVRAGLLTWEDVRRLQASLMPPCTVCGGAGLIGEYGYYLCADCYEVRHAR